MNKLRIPFAVAAISAAMSLAAQPPTVTVFDRVTDMGQLAIGADYYIVSRQPVPYAVAEGNPLTPQYLISSIAGAGLGVRAVGEGRPLAVTLSGYDAAYCSFMHNSRFYMGYDPTTGSFRSYSIAEDDLTDTFYFSISVDSDGCATISPYGNSSLSLHMIDGSGDAGGASLYTLCMVDGDTPGAVDVMLATGYREVLADTPEIVSTDGSTIAEPVVPDGYELMYRVRPAADVNALAEDGEWKPWDRHAYYTDVYPCPPTTFIST